MLSTSSNAPVADNSTTKHATEFDCAAARPFSRCGHRFSGGRRPNIGIRCCRLQNGPKPDLRGGELPRHDVRPPDLEKSEPMTSTHCHWSGGPSAQEAEQQEENDQGEGHAQEPQNESHES
jgi:hypothetical protein